MPDIRECGLAVSGAFAWNFEFGSRAAQALAPRVGIYLEFGFWCLEFYYFHKAGNFSKITGWLV